ncbi:MAG TPA: metallophosphoesterase [Alphaproteobacteria bacterium]|nr:metallophosphoesterase [Alphaproteobacteria bacterium]
MLSDQGSHGGTAEAAPSSLAARLQPPNVIHESKMVGWYDLSQLARTAVQVVTSTLFGRHADHRLLEALACDGEEIHDYAHHDDVDHDQRHPHGRQSSQEFWLDYVSDVGDGWHSTYAIAYYLAQPSLTVKDAESRTHATTRGAILVFGGDEVYPTPSPSAYDQRLVVPYETALRWTQAPHPSVYAIPGNHDWYDSLVAYTRLFCSRRWFAGWRTQQRRSYFALKLPHGWWLLGTDVQLGSDIDQPQVEFFQRVAAKMQAHDRVILCNAEPHWIRAKTYQRYDPDENENNPAFLEQKVLGKKVSVFIAGDLHHYRRHAAADGTQKITAGGGGAFLHPTHGQDVQTLVEEDKHRQTKRTFKLEKSFPDPTTSWWLCWRNLGFLYHNPTFGMATGVLYVLTSWAALPDIPHLGLGEIGLAAQATLLHILGRPVATCWVAIVLLAFILFTDTHSKLYRGIMGPLHGVAHIIATFFIVWGASWLSVAIFGPDLEPTLQLWLATSLTFGGGWIVGSSMVGLYLLISLNVFGRHANEAFSSLKIPDWKSFLRMKIDADGNLTIFPIGIRGVPRRWKPHPANTQGPERVPDDPKATAPELIEGPIAVQRSPGCATRRRPA